MNFLIKNNIHKNMNSLINNNIFSRELLLIFCGKIKNCGRGKEWASLSEPEMMGTGRKEKRLF